jgi:spore coat polysaccharide biosynthesis protein SpsF (cytidylyltransferase family)
MRKIVIHNHLPKQTRDAKYRVSTEGGDTYVIEAKSLQEAQRRAREDHAGERVTVYEERSRDVRSKKPKDGRR